MADWRTALMKLGHEADQQFDRLRSRLDQRLGGERDYMIQTYRWYGTDEIFTVRGRVLRDRGLGEKRDNDSLWNNLLDSYRRFNSSEVAAAELRISYGRVVRDAVTDDEGYFDVELPLTGTPAGSDLWQHVNVELVSHEPGERAQAEVLLPYSSATFGIISDVDDTIMQTFATNLVKAARLTFLNNAKMRLAFPGVAAFYRALQQGSGTQINPIFYVSSSPWNLYDLLVDFMQIQDIPAGPLCLRDYGLDEDKFIMNSHSEHKTAQIARIMNTYPELPFVLIGDSGQHDPEIYYDIVRAFPGRVKAIYIRDVSQEVRDATVVEISDKLRGEEVDMVLTENSLIAAEHALTLGLIHEDQLEPIRVATIADEESPDAIEQLVDPGTDADER